jgi:hypothetical protein
MDSLHTNTTLSVPEYLAAHSEKILERTIRILNPFESPKATRIRALIDLECSPGSDSDLNLGTRYLDEVQIKTKTERDEYFNGQAKKGIQLVTGLFSNISPEQKKIYKECDPYEGVDSMSSLRSYNGKARDPLAVIHFAAIYGEQYLKSLENASNRDQTELQVDLLSLFAASVAYAQTVFMDLFELKKQSVSEDDRYDLKKFKKTRDDQMDDDLKPRQKHPKHSLRDEVLAFGKQTWIRLGRQETITLFNILHANQLEV